MTKLTSITANIMVESVNETLHYYQSILGFEIAMTVPETGKYDWAWIKRDNVSLMIQDKENFSQGFPLMRGRIPGGSLTFYIIVDDIIELYNTIRSRVRIVSDMQQTFYGSQEFTIEDCNGYFLTFASES